MLGQLDDCVSRAGWSELWMLGQCLRDRAMQARPLAGQQRVVGRLTQECVAEAEGILVLGWHQDPELDRFRNRGVELVDADSGGGGQQLVVHRRPRRSRDPDHVRCLRGEALDPHHHDVSKHCWECLGVPRCRKFFCEEGVATRTRQHGVDEGPVGRTSDDVGEESRDLDPVETGQLELRDARVPAELGEETPKRAASFDLVSSVRGNHEHRVVVQVAGQEVDYFDAGGVGPLQVFEDEHYRRPGRQGLDALQQGLEHLRLDQAARGRRVDVTRNRRSQAEGSLREAEHCCDVTCRQLTCDVSQHTNNWTVRKPAAFGRSAGAERHESASAACVLAELLDQAGLAHAGIAAEQDCRCAAGR